MSVVVTLEPPEIEVEPGTSRDVLVRIRNTGEIVDGYTVSVTRDAAAWSSVTPNTVNLYPGDEEVVRVSLAPPRQPVPHAGRTVFGVYVQAKENPSDTVHEQGWVTVLPFSATRAELVPQTSRGSGRVTHRVNVTNGGNDTADVVVVASDADRLLQFDAKPDRLQLENGADASVLLTVTPVERFLQGPPQSRQFGVTVTSTKQEPFELRGSVLQLARLPNWLPKTLAGVGLAAVLAGFLVGTGVLPPKPTPTAPPPSQAVVPTPTPTPTPAPTPTPTAEITEQPSDPTPPPPSIEITPPPPGTLALTSVADAALANGALVANPACVPVEGEPCYDQAVQTVLLMLDGGLGGRFGGRGILNFATASQPVPGAMTLPIQLEADGGLIPYQSDNGTTGEAAQVVVDLAPLLADSFAYVVVESPTGAKRFVVKDDLAGQLLDTFYTRAGPPPTPGPIRTLPPVFDEFDPGDLQWQVFQP